MSKTTGSGSSPAKKGVNDLSVGLARREARQRAVSIIYEAKIKEITPKSVAEEQGRTSLDDLTAYLVDGVDAETQSIDAIIDRLSSNWQFDRLPLVEVCILEIAIFELLDGRNNKAVVINEAVELTKLIADPKSVKFINGILANIAKQYLEPNPIQNID